ncbi:MAG: hypothetical protein RIC55_10375 [Pirellulaceae bacterium]
MPNPTSPLNDIFAPGGPLPISRIEFEVLDSGLPRLLLWSETERLYCAPIADEDLELVPNLVRGLLDVAIRARRA